MAKQIFLSLHWLLNPSERGTLPFYQKAKFAWSITALHALIMTLILALNLKESSRSVALSSAVSFDYPPSFPATLWHYWLNRWWRCWGGEIQHPTIRSEPPVTPQPLPSPCGQQGSIRAVSFHDFKAWIRSHLAQTLQTSCNKIALTD